MGAVSEPGSAPTHRSAANEHVERELTRLLRRARVTLATYAAKVHPEIDLAAARLRLHKSTLSRGLARLESFGLIERQPDPKDARARLVALSADGTARMTQATAERRARLSAVLDRWDDADLETLALLLDRLNTDLE